MNATLITFNGRDFRTLPIVKNKSIIKKTKTVKIKNMRYLKLQAMDSLIDNKIWTVENIAKVERMYPDSLCDCYE